MIKLFENFIKQELENYIKDNWEELYNLSREKPIKFNQFGIKLIMGEQWTSECIYDYLENTGGADDIESNEYENYLFDAINRVKDNEKWKGYVYIDSDTTGVEFGITIFYK